MPEKYEKTGLAVFVAILLALPSLLAGGLMAWFYKSFLQFVLVTLAWLPFFEVIRTISLGFFGGLLHGGITAAGAVGGSGVIFKKANHQAVSYATSAVLVTLTVGAIVYYVSLMGYTPRLIEFVAFVIGLPTGAFAILDE